MRMLCAAVAALLVAVPALAARPDGQWRLVSVSIDWPVEHQSEGGMFCDPSYQVCVTNPTRCPWDGDDRAQFMFQGRLDPGETDTFRWCLMGDWNEQITWAESRTDGVAVTVTVGPTSVSGRVACVKGPDYDAGSLSVPALPSGGYAVETMVEVAVTNLTRRKLNHVTATGEIVSDFGQEIGGCVFGPRFGFDPAWQVGT